MRDDGGERRGARSPERRQAVAQPHAVRRAARQASRRAREQPGGAGQRHHGRGQAGAELRGEQRDRRPARLASAAVPATSRIAQAIVTAREPGSGSAFCRSTRAGATRSTCVSGGTANTSVVPRPSARPRASAIGCHGSSISGRHDAAQEERQHRRDAEAERAAGDASGQAEHRRLAEVEHEDLARAQPQALEDRDRVAASGDPDPDRLADADAAHQQRQQRDQPEIVLAAGRARAAAPAAPGRRSRRASRRRAARSS